MASIFAGRYDAADFAYGLGALGTPPPLVVNAGNGVAGVITLGLCTSYTETRDGIPFQPLTTTTPVRFGMGANGETLTPSLVSNAPPYVVAAFANVHGLGDVLSSATIGLQEAINYAALQGGGKVVVTPRWTALGGTAAMLTNAVMPATVTIEDLRASSTSGAGAVFDQNLNAASQATFRVLQAEGFLNYAGSVSSSGSIVGVRGALTLSAVTTLASGFAYGAQGKVTIKGTCSTANYVCGVLGQLDLSAAAANITITPLAAIWGDMGATVPAGLTAANADILKLTNTTSCPIKSCIYVNAVAAFFMDIVDIGTGGTHFVVGTTAGTAAGALKIQVGGATRYLQIFSAVV